MPSKRKRPDRTPSDGGRPSPHRPEATTLGQHERDEASRARGPGRQRGGYNHRRDSSQSSGRGSNSAQRNGSPSMRRNSGQNMPPPSSPAPTQPAKPVPSTPTFEAPPVVDLQGVIDYRHDNLTDDKLRSWADRGRKEIVAHGIQSREDEDITELSNLFQEFIHAVITEKLDPRDAGACVREILGSSQDSDSFAPTNLFIDSLAIILDSRPNQPVPGLRDFLITTEIPPSTIRQVLDAQILQQLGLARDNFLKKGVRFSTNHLYRQANFNLLREESEGYAKLITELYTTSDVLAPDVAEQTFEKIKALIGTFDLDVGRALDVTLDVAAVVLVKQFKFFVKLLRTSSWWPKSTHKVSDDIFTGGLPNWGQPDYPSWVTSEEDEALNAERRLIRDVQFWDRVREVHLSAFFELGGRRPTVDPKAITNGAGNPETSAEQSWIDITGTVPPSGNYVAAQLLGFKLLFYYSETRDPTDVLPANLLYLAAMLIKIGFISLTDLWPHLSPSDENMELVREKRVRDLEEEERKKRGGGQMNALLMAGVLPEGDDETPNAAAPSRRDAAKPAETAEAKSTPKETGPQLDEPHEQKVTLLVQLLTIGALPEALFILGRFPWIPEVAPEVLDGIHRILHVCIDKVYDECRPTATKQVPQTTKPVVDIDQSGMPKGSVRLTPLAMKKFLRWPTPDRNDHNEAQDYRYYWDEWTDNIPVCQNVDDFFTLCDSLLNVSGVSIGKDEGLLAKIASIGQKSLHDDKSEHNFERWKGLLKRILLPALSHTQANASAANHIWLLLKQYPLNVRYTLYAEWFEGQTSRLPAMKTAFARAQAETRATMKRVSLTNLPEMARKLSKTSYSSPGIVFRVAFEQLEVYPNLIDAIVECARYFTELSYDVLVWSLMNSLGKSRSRTQAEHALTTSKWLQALSKFTGKVYRRYRDLSPVPVLQYVSHQLLEGNSTDLIILRNLIHSMGGIVDQSDFTDAQVSGMAGGEWLRHQTLIRAGDTRTDNEKAAIRLAHSLTEADLGGALLINLAQFRQGAIFHVPEDEAHIKYLSSIVDDTQQILIQYLDFLWSNLDNASYDRAVPPISDLIHHHSLDVSLAFLIGRASLSARMFPWKKAQMSLNDVDKDGDANMSGTKTGETTDSPGPDGAAEDEQKSNDPSQIQTALQPIVESIRDVVPETVWQKITPELYVTFWALQLCDLFVPEAAYRREKERLTSEEIALKQDRTNMTKKGLEERYAKRKKIMDVNMALIQERNEHALRQSKWRVVLAKQFQNSFPEPRPSSESIADVLLEQCFLPRLLLSPADAEYTFKFVKTLHECNAPGFKYMALCDRLFNANRLRALIFTCSTREAEYFGRFLKLVLEDLSRWHKNEPPPAEKEKGGRDKSASVDKDKSRIGSYDKEAKGTSENPRLGFATEFDENGKPKAFVEHGQFKDLLFKWHKNLNMALKTCLGGTEWMHIRNALTVLKSVLDFFPAIDFMAAQFSAQLQKITKQEAASRTASEGDEAHRVDLSVAAQGALSELQRRKSKWMMVQAFRPNSGGKTPADGAKATELRPTAPEFKPQPARGNSTKTSAAEAEDGEVPDGRSKAAGTTDDKASADTLPPKPTVREVSKRDSTPVGTPRSSTPKPNHAQSQAALKNDSRPNTLPDRPPTNLPSRPDVPIPGHYSERHPQGRGHERRDNREPRESRESREPRGPRDNQRDHREPRDSRGESRETREHRDPRDNWPNSVEWNDRDREHTDRRPLDGPRDTGRQERPELIPRHPQGHDRDRPQRDGGRRGGYEQAKEAPASVPPPPPAPPASAAPEPTINPSRLHNIQKEQAKSRTSQSQHQEPQPAKGRRQPPADVENINPERQARVEEAPQGRSSFRDDAHSRSRNQSPRRGGRTKPDQPPTEPAHDSRPPSRTHASDVRASARDPRDRSPLPGSFRGERPIDRPNERGPSERGPSEREGNDGPRDHAFKRPPSRDDYDYRAHEESSYGRLNAVEPMNDPPSGPRGRGRAASARVPLGPHPVPPRPDNRYGNPHDTPDRAPPTGPSGGSGRGRRYESHGGPPPHGPGPMHQNQGRSFGNNADMAGGTPGVHPDRLHRVEQHTPSHHAPGQHDPKIPLPPPPPPGGPSISRNQRHSMGSTMTPDRAPRPDQRSTSGMPATPTPSSEQSKRKDQISNINSIMSQATKQEPSRTTSSRSSRSSRPVLQGSEIQVLTGVSPAGTPSQERQDPMRHHDSGFKHPNGDAASNNTPSRGEEGDRSRRDRDSRSDRPSRSSRRSSRDRERERSPTRDKENKEHRDYRDRRSAAGQEGRDDRERESRRSSRSGASAKEASSQPSRDAPRESRHHRGEPPKGAPEDWSAPGGNSRPPRGGGRDLTSGGGGRSDDRRDSGRKRRSEDQGGMMSDREKRPRR